VVTWIVVGAIVLGVLILVAAVLAAVSRVRPLFAARRRLGLRSEQAQRLQTKVAALQENVAALQGGLAETAARAEAIRRSEPT
jgi:hypothetical protein